MNNKAWIDNSGNFSATGDITSGASDERLKDNIEPINNAIEKVKQIKGVTFDWINNIEINLILEINFLYNFILIN